MKVQMTKEEYIRCQNCLEIMKDETMSLYNRQRAKRTFDTIYHEAQKRTEAQIIKTIK